MLIQKEFLKKICIINFKFLMRMENLPELSMFFCMEIEKKKLNIDIAILNSSRSFFDCEEKKYGHLLQG